MTNQHDTTDFTATYSAEDNKLRLYAAYRLDTETYQMIKNLGFRWAPKQELFVAPSWTPKREDICIALCGDIEAEDSTLAERATAKAERLEGYCLNRAKDANAFQHAAHVIGERFAGGQPILIGHHSEKKARRDQAKMHNNMDKAVRASKLSEYWAYRAEGVERHANYKNRPDVRARRIKTLLTDLRKYQRALNHFNKAIKLWEAIKNIADEDVKADKVKYYAGAYSKEGNYSYSNAYDEVTRGEISITECIDKSLHHHQRNLSSDHYPRWIEHTLNRLGYETALLGSTPIYQGTLTAGMLQTFCRTHGADKPKAKKQADGWLVTSAVPLPAHIGLHQVEEKGNYSLFLTLQGWCELMQSCGYVVEAHQPKRRGKALLPLLNIKADTLMAKQVYNSGTDTLEVVEMTKKEYSSINNDYKGTRISATGQFRFRVYYKVIPGHYKKYAVFLTDSKAHPYPA